MTTRLVQILLVLLHLYLIRSRHFQGGTITYKLVETSGPTVSIRITQTYLYTWPLVYCDVSRILSQSTPNMSSFTEYYYNLSCIANCTTSGGYQPVPVRTYCTDYSAAMSISGTQRTDVVNLTSGSYFKVAFASSAWRALSLPAPGSSSHNWSVSCIIDLRPRADTGKINTPPVVTMISPIAIPVGVQKALIIPTIDGDHDEVRCRYAQSADECGSICPPASLPNSTILISSNCTLLITGANVGDWYAVALQAEDFAPSNSTTPMNSVAVQFLINVYALPNCTTAPLLYGPSKNTGTCQSLQVGQSYTVTLYAENYCSAYGVTIQDIATLSFPIVHKTNLTQNTSTLYSVSLTWTPTTDDVGSQILCAVAIDSQKVQSNQYCLTFAISENNTATCSNNEMETTMSLAITTNVNDEESTTDDTTEMTTITTTITTTTVGSSVNWSWILPLVAVLASLLPPICCLCICCPPPYGYGLLYKTLNRDRPLKPSSNPPVSQRPPRMYMIRNVADQNFHNDRKRNGSFESTRSLTPVENPSNRFPITLRNNINKTGKNVVWISPSPRTDKTGRHDTNLSNSTSTTLSDHPSDSFPLTVRNRSNKDEKNLVWIRSSSELENASVRSSRLDSARTTTELDITVNSLPSTPRQSAQKRRKNIVRVHPSS